MLSYGMRLNRWAVLGLLMLLPSTIFASSGTTVTLSGPSYVYHDYATVTASVAPAGSYYYSWFYRFCYNGDAVGDCNGALYSGPQGYDVTSMTKMVLRFDKWRSFIVEVRNSPTGPLLATATHIVYGAGERNNSSCVICSGSQSTLLSGGYSVGANITEAAGEDGVIGSGTRSAAAGPAFGSGAGLLDQDSGQLGSGNRSGGMVVGGNVIEVAGEDGPAFGSGVGALDEDSGQLGSGNRDGGGGTIGSGTRSEEPADGPTFGSGERALDEYSGQLGSGNRSGGATVGLLDENVGMFGSGNRSGGYSVGANDSDAAPDGIMGSDS